MPPSGQAPGDNGARSELQALTRAISVLEYLAAAPAGEGSLTAVAQDLGLPKATVLRALRTWELGGYVTRTTDARYRLGWKLLVLARGRSTAQQLRDAARPYLEKLNERSMETVLLTLFTGGDVVYIDRFEGRQRVRVSTEIGQRVPLYATASGKAILAHQPDAVVSAVMESAVKLTPDTVTDLDRLRAELAGARKRGYASTKGELNAGVGAVGAPIRTAEGCVEAAVSIAFPLGGMTETAIRSFGEMTSETARLVSVALGWAGNRDTKERKSR